MAMFPDEFPFNKPLTMPANATHASISPATTDNVEPAAAPAPAAKPPLSPADAMIAAAVSANPGGRPPRERRRSPRQSINTRATLRLDKPTAPFAKIELQNLSMLGARFTSVLPLSAGDKASLKFEVGPLRWSSTLRVVNCIPQNDGSFAIGCEFVGNELQRNSIAA